jgi:hypothetical protein
MLGSLASPASIASCSVPRPTKGPEPTLNTGCANHESAHRVFPLGLARRAKPARNTFIGNRNSFDRGAILYKGFREVTIRRGKALSPPFRNSDASYRSTPFYNGTPLDTVKTRRPAGLKTSIYARIDQLYGTIPAAPSIYEAYQPDRRANADSAALFSLSNAPLTRRPIPFYERLRYNTIGKVAEYIIFPG